MLFYPMGVGWRVPPSRPGMGYPPIQTWDGVPPPSRHGMGYSPCPDLWWGTPPVEVWTDKQAENSTFPHPPDAGCKNETALNNVMTHIKYQEKWHANSRLHLEVHFQMRHNEMGLLKYLYPPAQKSSCFEAVKTRSPVQIRHLTNACVLSIQLHVSVLRVSKLRKVQEVKFTNGINPFPANSRKICSWQYFYFCEVRVWI